MTDAYTEHKPKDCPPRLDKRKMKKEHILAGAGDIYWVGNMPEGVITGDKIYTCGCIERDGKLWHRAEHWDTVLHPNELCPFHKEREK